MAVTAMVSLNGADQTSGRLVAFADGEVRGLNDAPKLTPFGPYKGKHLFGITIYANAEGETLSFMFDTLKGLAPLKETITFVDNGIQGSALPVVLTGSMPAESPPPPPPSPVDCRWDAADSDG